MLTEMVSKNTVKKVAKAWYGFKEPFSEESSIPKKPESLLDIVKKADAKFNKQIRKEG